MSPDQDRAVPFIYLSGYLREDFLHRMLHQALEVTRSSASPSSTALKKALAPIPVAGFRQFSKAPLAIQVRAAVSHFRESNMFVGWVLETWLEANVPLAAQVEEFLDAQKIPRERIQADEGTFTDRWSLDEVLRLADLFCAEHSADRDDVALMLCCLTSRAPAEETPAADEAAAAPEKADSPQ